MKVFGTRQWLGFNFLSRDTRGNFMVDGESLKVQQNMYDTGKGGGGAAI